MVFNEKQGGKVSGKTKQSLPLIPGTTEAPIQEYLPLLPYFPYRLLRWIIPRSNRLERMFESVGIQTLTTQFSFGENSETSCDHSGLLWRNRITRSQKRSWKIREPFQGTENHLPLFWSSRFLKGVKAPGAVGRSLDHFQPHPPGSIPGLQPSMDPSLDPKPLLFQTYRNILLYFHF